MSLIASGGVIFASAALLIVLSFFAGLKEFSLDFSNYKDPDLKLLPETGKSFQFNEDDLFKLKNIDGVEVFSAIVEERVVIQTENKNLIATLKGVDENYRKGTQIEEMISQGQWLEPNSGEVVAGMGISNNLSFGVFSFLQPLTIYVPKPRKYFF